MDIRICFINVIILIRFGKIKSYFFFVGENRLGIDGDIMLSLILVVEYWYFVNVCLSVVCF